MHFGPDNFRLSTTGRTPRYDSPSPAPRFSCDSVSRMTCRKHGWKHQRRYRPAQNHPQTASTERCGRCHEPTGPPCVTVAFVMPQTACTSTSIHPSTSSSHLASKGRPPSQPAGTAKRTSTHPHLRVWKPGPKTDPDERTGAGRRTGEAQPLPGGNWTASPSGN